ncbi:hypothetical protein [Actinomadura rayongensis]|uniref:Uncharacterized protein n=1 Tax=Actinomadura rayongensis TaxID=1429076 RepID=A0A6I4W6A9_9ACTN|nr:hypothetical protein [Actinomadura rayongensis]MXQ62664.1 hypothetical protein [Actinomadura rayongensis]
MSGSDDGRNPARPDVPAKEPADGAGPSAPPSFGAAPPADPARSAPTFKLDKPWWASDDTTADEPEPSAFPPAAEPPSEPDDTEPLPAQQPVRPTEATGPLRLPDAPEPPRPLGATGPQRPQEPEDADEPSRPTEAPGRLGAAGPLSAQEPARDTDATSGSAESTGPFGTPGTGRPTRDVDEPPRPAEGTGPLSIPRTGQPSRDADEPAREIGEPPRPAEGTGPLSTPGTGPLRAYQPARDTGESPFNRPPRAGEGTGPLRAADPPGVTLAAAAAKPVVPPSGQDAPDGPGGLPLPGLQPDDGPPVHPAGPMAAGPKGPRRRGALIGAGAVAAVLVLGAAGYALAGGDDAKKAAPTPTRPAPAASRTHHGQPPLSPTAPAAPSRIDNERTDPGPLALTAVFPTATVTLGGRGYVRDRSSVNHECALTARGAMAATLVKEKCRAVVRVTFVDRAKTVAITAGVAVLPSKAAALRTGRAGDPSRYEWFRGMQGKRSGQIDRAGGYAAATIRGRYVIYAYAQYLKGRPASGGPNLKTVARQFIDYTVRPVVARA